MFFYWIDRKRMTFFFIFIFLNRFEPIRENWDFVRENGVSGKFRKGRICSPLNLPQNCLLQNLREPPFSRSKSQLSLIGKFTNNKKNIFMKLDRIKFTIYVCVNLLLFFLFIFGLFEKILPGSRDLFIGVLGFFLGLGW